MILNFVDCVHSPAAARDSVGVCDFSCHWSLGGRLESGQLSEVMLVCCLLGPW